MEARLMAGEGAAANPSKLKTNLAAGLLEGGDLSHDSDALSDDLLVADSSVGEDLAGDSDASSDDLLVADSLVGEDSAGESCDA